jgi:hypothetical protein
MEQVGMLEDISENFFIDNPLGWVKRKGEKYDPILPDVKAVVEKYGWDEFKFISTKLLPSDWMAATSLNRAATKPLLMGHLSDEGWCGHYDEETLEEFHSWVKTEKPCKWCLQGLLKALAFVLYKQNDEKEQLCSCDFFLDGLGSGGVDDDGVIRSRLFQTPKNRVNVKGVFTMSDVSGHEHRQHLAKPKRGKGMEADDDTMKRFHDMLLSDGENALMNEKLSHFQLARVRDMCDFLLQSTIYDVGENPLAEELLEESKKDQ